MQATKQGLVCFKKSFSENEISNYHQEATMEDAELNSYESVFNDIQAKVVDEWPSSNNNIASVNRMGGQHCCVPLCRISSGQRIEKERLGITKLSFHFFLL